MPSDDYEHEDGLENNSAEEDDFLLREGFDLLATYRSIRDESVRQSVMMLIRTLAAAEQRS